jgi:hypothetical protein
MIKKEDYVLINIDNRIVTAKIIKDDEAKKNKYIAQYSLSNYYINNDFNTTVVKKEDIIRKATDDEIKFWNKHYNKSQNLQ